MKERRNVIVSSPPFTFKFRSLSRENGEKACVQVDTQDLIKVGSCPVEPGQDDEPTAESKTTLKPGDTEYLRATKAGNEIRLEKCPLRKKRVLCVVPLCQGQKSHFIRSVYQLTDGRAKPVAYT